MARPKLSAGNLRTKRISAWFNPAELHELTRRTDLAGLPAPEYLRQRAIRSTLHIEAPRRLAASDFRELQRIGSNLNQIARKLNQGGRAPANLNARLRRLQELINKLLPEVED